jgi:predicted  nucleic acid-binding Zn-ribbon protein
LHPDVQKLLRLQALDQEVARLQKELDALPAEETRRGRALAKARAEHDRAREALQQAEVQSRILDKGVQQSDDEVKKLDARLNAVKSNAEYQATLFQIESVKRERSRMEEEGLAVLEQIEGLRAAAEQAARVLAEEEQVFAGFQREAAQLAAERGRQVEAKSAGRPALLEGIPRELLERYERMFAARDGLVVCAAQFAGGGSVCQGCYSKVTTSDHARLMAGTTVVQCKSCQRILYPAD